MKLTKPYQHSDRLGIPLQPGQTVTWSSSWSKGVNIGIVDKLTKCRVKIKYKYAYTPHNSTTPNWHTITYQAIPTRVIVINEQTPSAITMHLMRQG